jgi:hypothetical protein
VNYLVPGILLIAIASGIVLWGHVLTSLVANAISVVVIIAVGLVMGLRSSAGVLPFYRAFPGQGRRQSVYAEWACPGTRTWIASRSAVPRLIASRPQPTPPTGPSARDRDMQQESGVLP